MNVTAQWRKSETRGALVFDDNGAPTQMLGCLPSNSQHQRKLTFYLTPVVLGF
jgi:hypothetical protein